MSKVVLLSYDASGTESKVSGKAKARANKTRLDVSSKLSPKIL